MDAFQPFALKLDPDAAARAKEEAFRVDLAVRLVCPSCPPDKPVNIIESFGDGDLVCGNCGLVLGDRVIDTRSEWRTFANEEGDDPSRVGGPTNALVDGPETFSTVISFRDNNTGVAKDLRKAAQTIHHRAGSKNVDAAFAEIQNMCDTMDLPRGVCDMAKQLYKRAEEEKVIRAKPIDAASAACIFIACRLGGIGRTFKEISAQTRVNKKDLAACFKILRLKFEGTGVSSLTGNEAEAKFLGELSSRQISASPEDLINRFASNLALPPHVHAAARYVANKVTNAGHLTGRSPITVACAVLYLVSHLLDTPKSAGEIATMGGMAESTIKGAYRIILPFANSLIDPMWLKTGRANLERLP